MAMAANVFTGGWAEISAAGMNDHLATPLDLHGLSGDGRIPFKRMGIIGRPTLPRPIDKKSARLSPHAFLIL